MNDNKDKAHIKLKKKNVRPMKVPIIRKKFDLPEQIMWSNEPPLAFSAEFHVMEISPHKYCCAHQEKFTHYQLNQKILRIKNFGYRPILKVRIFPWNHLCAIMWKWETILPKSLKGTQNIVRNLEGIGQLVI